MDGLRMGGTGAEHADDAPVLHGWLVLCDKRNRDTYVCMLKFLAGTRGEPPLHRDNVVVTPFSPTSNS